MTERTENRSYPATYLEAIEQEMKSVLQSFSPHVPGAFDADFFNILTYHLGWTDPHGGGTSKTTGKRLRPLICLLSCEAAINQKGGEDERWRDALPAAAAIELIHNFTLIHDDIQDNSAERHGRPAVWKVWGIAQGINAGDALFTFAHLASDRLFTTVPHSTHADVRRILDTATLAITRGQFLDLSFETREQVTVDEYLEMVRGKTAALIAASAEIGARIASDESRLVDAFARYGANLGMAFQIADDILGIWGDPGVTGKPAGGDILAKKKSLPLLLAAQDDRGGEIKEFFANEDVRPEDVTRIAAALDRLGTRASAEALARDYSSKAASALNETGLANDALHHLEVLVSSAVRRDK